MTRGSNPPRVAPRTGCGGRAGSIILWYLFTILVGAAIATSLTFLVIGSFLVIPAAAVAWLIFVVIVRAGACAVRGVWRSTAYPHRHWTRFNRGLPIVLVITPILGVWAVGWTLDARRPPDEKRRESIEKDQGAAMVDAFFLLWLLISTHEIHVQSHYVRVTPYFESKVGETDTYCTGKCLARHVLDLDDLARAQGVTPPSEFGWNDDFAGEALLWHKAATGLKTVNALLAHLQNDEFARREHIGVIDDLKRIAHALGRADHQGIRFCLLLQHGEGTYSLEHEMRKGTFF